MLDNKINICESEEDSVKEESLIIKRIKDLMTNQDIDGNAIPSYCQVDAIEDEFDLSQEEVISLAKECGCTIYKTFSNEEMDGGYIFAHPKCTLKMIKDDYMSFYGLDVEIEEVKDKVEEKLLKEYTTYHFGEPEYPLDFDNGEYDPHTGMFENGESMDDYYDYLKTMGSDEPEFEDVKDVKAKHMPYWKKDGEWVICFSGGCARFDNEEEARKYYKQITNKEFKGEFEVDDTKPFGYKEEVSESLKLATPYMLRNDGTVFECISYHPYISNIYDKENDLESLVNERVEELKWFYDNTKQDDTKKMIKSLVKSCINLGISGNIEHSDEELNKMFDTDDVDFVCSNKNELYDLMETLNNQTNQEFCKVRTSDVKQGGNSKDIYFRISSVGFNWFNIIWKFVADNVSSIDTVTICRDGRVRDFSQGKCYKLGGVEIDHISVEEFLTLKGNPVIECFKGSLKYIEEANKLLIKGCSLEESYKDLNYRDIKSAYKRHLKEQLDFDIEHSLEVSEDIEKHDELNPVLFDGQELKSEVKDKLIEIANYFMDNAKEDGVEFDVKDILMVGSNANYNYTKDSDIDLHIVVSRKPECNKKEHLGLIYQAYKSMFNNKFDCTINGVPVEIYVEFEDEDVVETPTEETNLEEDNSKDTSYKGYKVKFHQGYNMFLNMKDYFEVYNLDDVKVAMLKDMDSVKKFIDNKLAKGKTDLIEDDKNVNVNVSRLKKSKLKEGESVTPTTPYMLRNDGELLKCGEVHPYIKSSLTQSFENVYKELEKHTHWVEWFKTNSKQERVKVLCDKFLKEGLDEKEFNELNDLTNQEFCRVRTSNYKMKFGGDNGEIYFRISSKDFNWFDLIWKVVADNKNNIKNVTVMRDTQSLGGKDFDYYEIKGVKLTHIDVDTFLTLSGNPVIEDCGGVKNEK